MNSIAEIDSVTKEVLSKVNIQSSSDFITVAYALHQKFYSGIAKRIEPILKIEKDNHFDRWESNCVCSERKICDVNDTNSMYHLMIGYRIVLDYFLNDDVISRRFNLDLEDKLGWQIFKELDTKYSYCRKKYIRMSRSNKEVEENV